MGNPVERVYYKMWVYVTTMEKTFQDVMLNCTIFSLNHGYTHAPWIVKLS